jgi:hypothetical protein
MKIATVALAAGLALGSTFALAQGADGGGGGSAGGAAAGGGGSGPQDKVQGKVEIQPLARTWAMKKAR